MPRAAKSAGTIPAPTRPQMPAMYSFDKKEKKWIDWAQVEKQLADARNYWVATTRRDGRPHVMPVWGMYIAGAILFGTHEATQKARHLERQPCVVIHLESGDDVVIVEGVAEKVDLKSDLSAADKESRRKYQMPLFTPPGSVMYRVRPKKVFAWREKDFPKSGTRWVF